MIFLEILGGIIIFSIVFLALMTLTIIIATDIKFNEDKEHTEDGKTDK